MNKNIKNAFDSIHADEALINNTIEYVNKKRIHKKSRVRQLVPIAASFILFMAIGLFGYKVYNTSTVVLSVDINPSLEIGVNRFDKVISVKEFNSDGEAFVESIDIKNMNYKDALGLILENKDFENEEIAVTVAGKAGKQKNNISSNIENISKEKQNIYCDSATDEEVSEAHTKGLSFGKYKAYLKLVDEGYELTEDEVKNMSVKEIKDKLRKENGEGKDHQGDEDGNKGHNGKHENGEEASKDENVKDNEEASKDENVKDNEEASKGENGKGNEEASKGENGKGNGNGHMNGAK